jgi:anti-anti-sigma regulatory factor
VSRDEAHLPVVAGRAPDEGVRPQPPLFIARTDETAGVIRTRGHLDRTGAEVLCRTVTALQRLGHRCIVVRFGSATVVDDDAGTLLADRARTLRGEGVLLLLA